MSAEGTIYQVGIPPNRVDVLTFVDGVSFEEAWRDRMVVDIDGLNVPIIGRAHLGRNKRALGRPQDLVDADMLESQG